MSGELPGVPVAPGRLPLAGHVHRLRRRPLDFLGSLRGLGDLVRVDIGPYPVYVATTAQAAHDALATQARRLDQGALFTRLTPLLGEGLLTSNGEIHTGQRRLLQPAFTPQSLVRHARSVARQAADMVERWRPGERIMLNEALIQLSFATVAEVMFDSRPDTESGLANAMCDVVSGAFTRVMLPGPLTRVPVPTNRRYDRALARLHAGIDQTIRESRARGGTGAGLLGYLNTVRGPEGDPLTDKQMRDHYITMMLAGSETTPTVLGWAFHHIAADPAVERRLRREWHEVLGDRPVRQEDLPALTYTGQVVKEALRLYPPSVLMRRTHSEATVAGIAVPVGTDLLVSPYAMHRDPRLFPDPLTFDPARWEFGRDALPKGAYAPFGEGNRRCIGERFAGLSMPIVLATVLRRWQLRPDTRHRVREIQSAHPHVDALPMFVGEVRASSATA